MEAGLTVRTLDARDEKEIEARDCTFISCVETRSTLTKALY